MPEPESDCKATVVKSTSDNKDITPDCDKNSAPKHPETFGELIEMIQSGLTLPDTEGPEIEATNDDPTPTVLERKKKPWEDT